MRSLMLNKIMNKKVTDFHYDGESICLGFEGNIGLAIHNERVIKPNNMNSFEKAIIDKRLLEIDEKIDSIEFIFGNDIFLKVLLDDDSYYSPEAMELRIPNEPIVVWN